MNSIDNIHPGQWLIITADKDYEKILEQTKMFAIQAAITPRIKYTGIPFKVIAISAPFLLVQTGTNRSVVDTRNVTWTVADQKYVREFSKITLPSSEMPGSVITQNEPNHPPEKLCPRCHCPMVERLVDGVNIWHLYCNECGGEFI